MLFVKRTNTQTYPNQNNPTKSQTEA